MLTNSGQIALWQNYSDFLCRKSLRLRTRSQPYHVWQNQMIIRLEHVLPRPGQISLARYATPPNASTEPRNSTKQNLMKCKLLYSLSAHPQY